MTQTANQNDELLAEFLDEAMDSLQDLPARLGDYHQHSANADAIHFVFRSIHTIKGNAGFFGFVGLKKFAHSLEDSLDLIRQNDLEIDEELLRLLIDGLDVIGALLQRVASGDNVPALDDEQEQLLARIDALCQADQKSAEERLLDDILQLADELSTAGSTQGETWANRLRDLVGHATAEFDDSQTDADGSKSETDEALPADKLQSLNFKIADRDINELVQQAVAAFVSAESDSFATSDGDTSLAGLTALAEALTAAELSEAASGISKARTELETLLGSGMDIDAFLLSIVWDQLGPQLQSLQERTVAPASEPSDQGKTNETEATTTTDEPAKSRFLRVKEDRVDEFLDDVSSLFITCERLKDLQTRMTHQLQSNQLVEELRQINTALNCQTTELQRSVVELRKVPVRGLFSKFPRVARTLASNLGKQLEVHLAGEELEIDKSLVEDLDGPLMHMVRNVCDHGIETPQEREARGANPTGNLWMECELTKTHVVITIRDDGRGIDPHRLRDKAVDKGVLSREAVNALSDQEAVELIFHPGFSTADKISEVSGRGVGLDVVRTRLREHNGDVRVTSVVGEGTTFRLQIPIRKAVVVVDGLLIGEQGETFVLPFDHISEITRLDAEDLATVQGLPIAKIRGEPYGAVRLHRALGCPAKNDASGELFGVLVRSKKGTLCLLVDAVLGQRKVVIGAISDAVTTSDKIGGVAQLGAGHLALVLNADELIDAASGT